MFVYTMRFSLLLSLIAGILATAQPTSTPTATPSGEPTCINCHGAPPVLPVCSSTGSRTGFVQSGSPSEVDLFLIYQQIFEYPAYLCNGSPSPYLDGFTASFNDYSVLSVPLTNPGPLNGTLSGPECFVNNLPWITACYNFYNLSTIDVPYFTLDSRGHKLYETKHVNITVANYSVVPIPDLYPYNVNGICPPGLVTIATLCEPPKIPPLTPPMCSSTGKRVGSVTHGLLQDVDLVTLYQSKYGSSLVNDCEGESFFYTYVPYYEDDRITDDGILNAYVLTGSESLNGTLSGSNCKLNNFTWITACYNDHVDNQTIFDVTHFTFDANYQRVKVHQNLTVPNNTVVPIPDYYPYANFNKCPRGLKMIPTLCEPLVKPDSTPTATPFVTSYSSSCPSP